MVINQGSVDTPRAIWASLSQFVHRRNAPSAPPTTDRGKKINAIRQNKSWNKQCASWWETLLQTEHPVNINDVTSAWYKICRIVKMNVIQSVGWIRATDSNNHMWNKARWVSVNIYWKISRSECHHFRKRNEYFQNWTERCFKNYNILSLTEKR